MKEYRIMKLNILLFRCALIASSLCLTASNLRAAAPTPATAPATAPATIPAHEGLFRKLIVDLKLTPEQKQELKAIIKPFHEKMTAWHDAHKDELKKIHAELKAARQAKDREKAQAAIKEFRTLWQSAPHVRDILPQIKKVLTPEQLEIVKQRLVEWREQHTGLLRALLERHEHAATQPTTNK